MLNQQTKKKWIKAAGVALVIMLGAAGGSWAQTETGLVKVGVLKGFADATGSADDICKVFVERYCTEIASSNCKYASVRSYTNKFELSGNGGSWGGLTCGLMQVTGIEGMYGAGSVVCYNGGIYSDHPDGCYEQRDVTQECQAARENLLQQGTPLPEYCNEFPPSPPLCQQMPSGGSHVGGRVACTDIDGREYLEACFFSERLPSSFRDAQARQMIGACIIEHENIHAEDEARLCIDKRPDTGVGSIGFRVSNKDLDRAERNAYMQETDCLLSKKEFCMTQQCRSEIDRRVMYTIGKSLEYTNNLAN